MEPRDTPYSAFKYLVYLDDGTEREMQGGFSEVSGLNAEVTIAEYRNGSAASNYATKVPTVHKAGDVTLKRGVIDCTNVFEWLNQVRNGDLENAKRNVEVRLQSEDPTSDSPVVTWKLINAIPIKWTGPTLNATGGRDVAMEEIVLSADAIEIAPA